MYSWQFIDLRYFSAAEVRAAGARVASVQRRLFVTLDRFRLELGRTVDLLYDGLTTGKHRSYTHEAGLAADICFRESEGVVNVRHAGILALHVGFTGVGVYWNGAAYSMHLDLGWTLRQWVRWRHHREVEWHESAFLVDPRDLEERDQ